MYNYETMSLYIDLKYTNQIAHRFEKFSRKNDYLFNVRCPICGDSKKNLSKMRGFIFRKENDMFYKCHNCGQGLSLGNLIKYIDPNLYKEYILERFKNGESGNSNFKKPSFNIPSPRFGKVEKEKIFENAEWLSKLPSGHFCLVYCTNRGFLSRIADRLLFTSNYRQFIDALVPNHEKKLIDDARLIIPFYDEYNNLIAVSGRALETSDKTLRYITIRTTDSTDKLIYGMDTVDTSKTMYVVEGPIDSFFIDNAVAAGDANLTAVADKLGIDNTVLIYDNEPRNREIVNMVERAVKNNYRVVIWPNTVEGKDINEMIMDGMTESEIKEIIDTNTFSGLRALTEFTYWKKL